MTDRSPKRGTRKPKVENRELNRETVPDLPQRSPEASAAGPPVYRTVQVRNPADIARVLNDAHSEGLELVDSLQLRDGNVMLILRRQKGP